MHHPFENCDYYKVSYGRWAERASLAHSPYKSLYKLQFSKWCYFTVLWSVTLKIGALTKLGLFFPVVCFIHVFDQTLAEQLYVFSLALYLAFLAGKPLLLFLFSVGRILQSSQTWHRSREGPEGAGIDLSVARLGKCLPYKSLLFLPYMYRSLIFPYNSLIFTLQIYLIFTIQISYFFPYVLSHFFHTNLSYFHHANLLFLPCKSLLFVPYK